MNLTALQNPTMQEHISDVTATKNSVTASHHNPRRFSNNMKLNIDRGLNLINMNSAQNIAAWIYTGRQQLRNATKRPKFDSWSMHEKKEKFLSMSHDAQKLQGNDTMFVPYALMQEFTRSFLPHIKTPVVLFSFPWGERISNSWLVPAVANITSNSYILKWFAQNIGRYTGGFEHHPKVHPFPLGLKTREYGPQIEGLSTFLKKQFMERNRQSRRTVSIYVSPMRITNDARRILAPYAGGILPYQQFLTQLSKSYYVTSPDGDHPDCHRHYEAIALGAVPITQLDPHLYSHLEGSGIIFNNTEWNITHLHSILPIPPKVCINRNIIFQEYWIEHVERVVGRPLRWWDNIQQSKAFLNDFFVTKPQPLLRL
jgi:hypothetical protein